MCLYGIYCTLFLTRHLGTIEECCERHGFMMGAYLVERIKLFFSYFQTWFFVSVEEMRLVRGDIRRDEVMFGTVISQQDITIATTSSLSSRENCLSNGMSW
jgi:hypothetical protein